MNRFKFFRLPTAVATLVLALLLTTPGSALAQPQSNDPFGAHPDPVTPAAKPESQRYAPQAPAHRHFQIELLEVAEDQLSFRKIVATGYATVIPQGEDALPEVKLSRLRVVHPTARSGNAHGAPMGGTDYAKGYPGGGMGGMEDAAPPWNGTAAQREEIEKRITWQAQIDWVHTALRSRPDPKDADVDEWKQLIKPVLRAQYLDQMRRQKVQIAVVEKQLEQMKSQLARRASAADSVVEFELRRLELQAGGLGMQPDATLQSPTAAGTDPGDVPGEFGAGQGYGQREGGMF